MNKVPKASHIRNSITSTQMKDLKDLKLRSVFFIVTSPSTFKHFSISTDLVQQGLLRRAVVK